MHMVTALCIEDMRSLVSASKGLLAAEVVAFCATASGSDSDDPLVALDGDSAGWTLAATGPPLAPFGPLWPSD